MNTVSGIRRSLFSIRMAISVFFFYLAGVFSGKRNLKSFVETLRRLSEFRGKQGHAKFVEMYGGTRIGLYVPTFPSKAFFRASDNMFGQKGRARCVTAVISITSKCFYDCDYCYQKLNRGSDTPLERLVPAVREMQDEGVAIFVLEGGEPFARFDRLVAVCEAIDDRSEIWINTTGTGVTRERLLLLRGLGMTALKISIHHHQKEAHNAFLKSDLAYDKMRECVHLCQELGISFAFNSYMPLENYLSGHFEEMLRLARKWRAAYIQCLTPRSAGGNLQEKPYSYSVEELEMLSAKIRVYNRKAAYIDYPAIFFDDFEERCVVGCTAGGAGRVYLNSQGELQPCHAVNITFGNIKHRPYTEISDQMRGYFIKPHCKTACTALTPAVTKCVREGAPIPVPFQLMEEGIRDFGATIEPLEVLGRKKQ